MCNWPHCHCLTIWLTYFFHLHLLYDLIVNIYSQEHNEELISSKIIVVDEMVVWQADRVDELILWQVDYNLFL